MKRKLFIILSTLVLIITLLFSFVVKDNKIESKKEISKVEKILSKPKGIQAFTLEGEKTNKGFNDLINNYVLDKITCKNGTIATYNKATNEVSLSNIHMPDYCTMNFKYTIYGKLLADNTTIKTRTDFSSVFTETNTGTLYKSTESIAGSTPKEVYYFAGNAKNNWVKFAGYYWKIIRTNHDGSVRLLYSGTSPDTTEGYIGTSAFNTEFNSPKYVGYMYGEDDSTLEGIRANTKDSTIKTYIDNWYKNNLIGYTKYLSKDAVYCNDRGVASGLTYSISLNFNYSARERLFTNKMPSYNCIKSSDVFSGSSTEAELTYPIALMTADEIAYAGGVSDKNNAKIWYYHNVAGESITGSAFWWLLSPGTWYGNYSGVWYVNGKNYPGYLNNGVVNNLGVVRPVISLKGDLVWKSGDGSSNNPYEVEDLPPTLSEKLLADNPTIKTRTDFSATFTETNTGTLFKSTESIAVSTPKDVYYFAGNALNNWVKFGGFYWRIIRTNHDESVRLLFHGKSPNSEDSYIKLTSTFNNYQNDSMYVGYMYGTSGMINSNKTNINNSVIKNTVDKWYEDNLISLEKYLSLYAVYCADRGDTNDGLYPSGSRLDANKTPSFNCLYKEDSFSSMNLKAKLKHPLALMTADEISFAGGVYNLENKNVYYYMNSENKSSLKLAWWWLMSPYYGTKDYSAIFGVFGSTYPGKLRYTSPNDTSGAVRPVISIKSDALWSSGTGSPENPYEIIYN